MAVGANGLENVKPSDVIYRVVYSDGGTAKTYSVPADKVPEFERSLESIKQNLKQELGKEVDIIKVQKLF